MKEIKAGQVWISKYGNKGSKVTVYITEQLNASCWNVHEQPTEMDRMMTSNELIQDFVLVNKK